MNKQETAMAKKETQPQEPLQQSEVQQASQQQQQPQAQQVPQEPQGPRYRYNENMIDWEGLDKIGISKATLEQQGLLDSMLRGYKTNKLVPLTLNIPGVLTTSKSLARQWVGSASMGYWIFWMRSEASCHALWTKWVSQETE